ncbi:hypothetical protein C8R45DRAFT_934087 [Mycena sanguinolenta]|nr:hypothetical protein C8R45DRAFT_934087 [Mycena sanguinolenta]
MYIRTGGVLALGPQSSRRPKDEQENTHGASTVSVAFRIACPMERKIQGKEPSTFTSVRRQFEKTEKRRKKGRGDKNNEAQKRAQPLGQLNKCIWILEDCFPRLNIPARAASIRLESPYFAVSFQTGQVFEIWSTCKVAEGVPNAPSITTGCEIAGKPGATRN